MNQTFRSLAYIIPALTLGLLNTSCVTPAGTSSHASAGPISLHSPTLAAKWQVSTDDQWVRYVDPSHSLNFLAIRRVDGPGPARSEPPLVTPIGYGDPDNTDQKKPYKQAWKYTTIAGQNVRWYQEDEGSGADFPAFSTEPFAITNASGKKEYYRVIVCDGMQGNYVAKIDQMMRSVTLR